MRRFISPSHWFGPLFRLELIRIARHGSHYTLRLVLAVVLLAALMAVYSSWFPTLDLMSLESDVVAAPAELARFAEAFVFIVLMLQLVVVVALTPFHVVTSIVEERQKRTMDYLLASPLSSREIIFGKLAARLLFVLTFIVMVLPLLALLQSWGGIDMEKLIEGYVVIIFTMLALGGMSARFADETNSTGEAIFAVYLVFFGVGIIAFCLTATSSWFAIASPFVFLWRLFNDTKNEIVLLIPILAVVYGIIAVTASLKAAENLRSADNRRERLAEKAASRASAEYKQLFEAMRARVEEMERSAEPSKTRSVVEQLPLDPRRPGGAYSPPEPLDENEPLLWKENNYPRTVDWLVQGGCVGILFIFLMAGVVTLSIGLLAAALAGLAGGSGLGAFGNMMVRWLGLLLLYCWGIASGLRAASTVTRERQHQTLDCLFTLPVNRRDILAAKWLSCFRSGSAFRMGLIGLGILSLPSSAVSPLALPLAVIAAVIFVVFCVTLGLWLSTVCPTTLRATIFFIATLFVLTMPPVLMETFAGIGEKPHSTFIEAAISPAASWHAVVFFWGDLEGDGHSSLLRRLLGAFVDVVGLGLASCVLWFHARWRFENEGK